MTPLPEPALPSGAAYDEIVAWYGASIRGGALIHELVLPALAELGHAVGSAA